MNELRIKIDGIHMRQVLCKEFLFTNDGIFNADGDRIFDQITGNFEISVIADCGSCLNQTSGSIDFEGPNMLRVSNRKHKFYHLDDVKPLKTEETTMSDQPQAAQIIADAIVFRDAIAEQKKQFEANTQDLKDAYAACISELGKVLDREAIDSLATSAGTAFRATKTFVNVADFEQFKLNTATESLRRAFGADAATDEFVKFVVDALSEDGPLHFMGQSVKKTAIQEYMEVHGDIPPAGIKFETATEIQVRRK